jgi:hypothetical protein
MQAEKLFKVQSTRQICPLVLKRFMTLPLNFLSYNLRHFKKFRVSLYGILYSESLGGLQLKKNTL